MDSINNHIIPKEINKFHKNEIPLLNSIDCVILGFFNAELQVLLIKFPYEPHIGHWSLIGGFVQPHTDIDLSVRITIEKMTGLNDVYLEQVQTFGEINRVPSERVVTICYYALINVVNTMPVLTSQHEATWFSINELPHLVYDHEKMIKIALQKLYEKVRRQPIGLELLPKKFTLYQLLKLYESVLIKKIDKRNFLKKMMNLKILNKLNEKDNLHSKRSAFLFEFNKNEYEHLVQKGFEVGF